MKLGILSYNTQLLKFSTSFADSLLTQPADFYCLQRVSREWVQTWKGPHCFQEQFPGSPFGSAILSRQSFRGRSYALGLRAYPNNSQGHAVAVAENAHVRLVNALPPFLEPPDVMAHEFDAYVRQIFERESAGAKTIWVGDFHREMRELGPDLPTGLVNHSRQANFLDARGNGLNLTKLITNFPAVTTEQVLPIPRNEAVSHRPVLFHVDVPD